MGVDPPFLEEQEEINKSTISFLCLSPAKIMTYSKDEPKQDGDKNVELGVDGKPTLGEELFLVHLSRHKNEAPSEDDFDHDLPRKRARSIGEELWEVHMQRSKGLEPDFDVALPKERKNRHTPRKNNRKSNLKKPARCSERLAGVLHLRNRDVKLAH